MKEILKKIFFVFLCLMFIGYLLVTGVSDLVNTKDIHTVNIDGCKEILEIEHTINGLIPIGKDHYYFAYDYEENSACIIKARKSWYKKNFNESGEANSAGGLTVTVLAKRVSDHEVSTEIMSRLSAVEGVNYSVNPGYALDIDYKLNAIEKLALLVVGLVMGVLIYAVSKHRNGDNSTLGKIVAVLAIVFLVLVLKVIV